MTLLLVFQLVCILQLHIEKVMISIGIASVGTMVYVSTFRRLKCTSSIGKSTFGTPKLLSIIWGGVFGVSFIRASTAVISGSVRSVRF